MHKEPQYWVTEWCKSVGYIHCKQVWSDVCLGKYTLDHVKSLMDSHLSLKMRGQKANQILGVIWKGKDRETYVIMMPLCISCAPTSWTLYVALVPNPQSFNLKKAYPRTGEGSEDINNHQNYGMPRERIVNLKERWLRRSIKSWGPGLGKLKRVAHCLFLGTLGSQKVAASKEIEGSGSP